MRHVYLFFFSNTLQLKWVLFFFFLIPHFAELPYFFFFYRTKKKKMSFLNVNNNLFLKVILLG